MHTAKTLIRLGGCRGWSESSLGAHSLWWFCHEAAHICFFAYKPLPDEKLEKREPATRKIDPKVRECAKALQDIALLAKLSAGDLVALEAKYHAKCLVALYTKAERAESVNKASGSSRHESMCHAIALADIVSYMEDCKYDQSVIPVFPMPEIVNMHSDRLKQLGIDHLSTIHSTKLKDTILANVTDLQAHKEGWVNLLAFNEDVGPALKKACEDDDFDWNFIQIHKTAKLIRNNMLHMSTPFSGSFPSDCQRTSTFYRIPLRKQTLRKNSVGLDMFKKK